MINKIKEGWSIFLKIWRNKSERGQILIFASVFNIIILALFSKPVSSIFFIAILIYGIYLVKKYGNDNENI